MVTERIHTYCAMCVSRCGVVATVEDGRFSKVSRDPEHPNGCICVKGTAAPEIVYSPDRLRYPMKRTRPKGDPDPGWQPISWNDALEMTAERITGIRARDGAEAVVFGYATPAGSATFELKPWIERLANAFGSPNLLEALHVCGWNRMFGAKHTYGVLTPSMDLDHAECILLWGTNPQVTQPTTAMRISAARKRGAKLIVIDPRKHALAEKADCWLRVRPGSDGALALAMIHVLLEEGLLDEAFARDWTNAPFLVREDTGALLTAVDLSQSGDGYVVWDSRRGGPVVCEHGAGYAEDGVVPALSGRFDICVAEGSRIECRPVLDGLRDLAAEFAPERSSEITWIAPDDVRLAVRLFVNGPSAFESWTGTELHSNAMQANRAIACFYGLTGQFDRQGSNVMFAPTPVRPNDGRSLLPDEKRARRLGLSEHPLGPPNDPGIVQHERVYEAILAGNPYPVKAMVLFGSDILIGFGDPLRGKKALEALDFYVHVDVFENPSASFADLLLPACTTWESEMVRASFRGTARTMNWTQLKKAVVKPVHDSRPDLEIIFELADRLELGEHFFDGDIDAAWNQHLEPSGLTVQQLRDNPVGLSTDSPTVYRKYAETNSETGRMRGFSTPSGRIELYATRFPEEGYSPLPVHEEPADSPLDDSNTTFPLVLTSFRSMQFVGPQHRNIPRLRAANPEPCMELHPDTARAAGIEDGQWARIETAVGEIKMKAQFNSNLHPRVVCAPYGWWQECKELGLPGYDPFGPDGANVNLMISNAYIDPISAAVPHRSRMCRVTRLDST